MSNDYDVCQWCEEWPAVFDHRIVRTYRTGAGAMCIVQTVRVCDGCRMEDQAHMARMILGSIRR